MEVKNNHRLRPFEIVDNGWCYHINSPLLENGLKTFKEKRLFYLRFRMLEKRMDKPWSARTDINNYKMRSILEKLGASIYAVDTSNGKIYYCTPESTK